MYLTQSNVIKGLKKKEYALLLEMCRYSNNLYNVALYNIRQYYFLNKKFLTYESNYHECKSNENYGLLQAGISQQILKVVDRNFKSFFNLMKKTRSGEYRYQDIKMPHYKEKGSLFPLVMSTNAIHIRNGYFTVPVSREFKKKHPSCDIRIPFPERLQDKTIKEVRILPCRDGRIFKVQYVYEVEKENVKLDSNKTLAVDIGVDNLASCISTIGTPFIVDGRRLKSINQGWNKQKARLQSINDKQHKGEKKTYTKRMSRITERRNNQTKDIMRKAARYIINHCIDNKIGNLVVGYNPDFKRYTNLGKANNQTFANISFGDFRQLLQGLCERYGINYIEQEESYTSKSSFLDGDILPEYKPEQPYQGTFKGNRIKRGLYQTKEGYTVNADINGAANILKKSKQKFNHKRLCSGLLASPLRVRLI